LHDLHKMPRLPKATKIVSHRAETANKN